MSIKLLNLCVLHTGPAIIARKVRSLEGGGGGVILYNLMWILHMLHLFLCFYDFSVSHRISCFMFKICKIVIFFFVSSV